MMIVDITLEKPLSTARTSSLKKFIMQSTVIAAITAEAHIIQPSADEGKFLLSRLPADTRQRQPPLRRAAVTLPLPAMKDAEISTAGSKNHRLPSDIISETAARDHVQTVVKSEIPHQARPWNILSAAQTRSWQAGLCLQVQLQSLRIP